MFRWCGVGELLSSMLVGMAKVTEGSIKEKLGGNGNIGIAPEPHGEGPDAVCMGCGACQCGRDLEPVYSSVRPVILATNTLI